ncbi:transposase [Streptomyces sp. NBC_00096]|uniref:transposase n=1 Tax=Streptomyces sp. NBC_00096 TaxID=2975650 RepID=UPI003248A7F0
MARSTWLADQRRDRVRSFVVQHLRRPDGVLVLDEAAFLKKGRMSAGVARRGVRRLQPTLAARGVLVGWGRTRTGAAHRRARQVPDGQRAGTGS